jgi:hypothetical protein
LSKKPLSTLDSGRRFTWCSQPFELVSKEPVSLTGEDFMLRVRYLSGDVRDPPEWTAGEFGLMPPDTWVVT